MAQYFEDWSGSTIGSEPTGWTKRWVATQTVYEVQADESGYSYSGKKLFIDKPSAERSLLSLDALDADPARATIKVAMCIRHTLRPGSSFSGFGVGARASGAATSENGVVAATAGTGSAETSNALRRLNYANGSGTLPSTVDANGLNADYVLLKLSLSGTSFVATIATVDDPDTILATINNTVSITGSGWGGIFSFNSGLAGEILWIGFGTDGDDAPTAPLSGTAPVAFVGTVSNQTGTEGTPFSLSLASYFSGTETPFTYSLQSGTLPSGWSLDSLTCVLSASSPSATTISDLVVRATDSASNTADTNSFSITIDAALSPPSIAPGSTVATAVSSSQIDVSFAAVSGAEGYDIERDGEATPLDLGNVLTYSHTGLSASTAYSYRVRAYNAAGDGPWSASFGAMTDAAGTAITLVTDLDASNVSASLSTITDATSLTPTIRLEARPDANNGNLPGWRHIYCAVENASGKSPIFQLNRDDKQSTTTPITGWIPMYTTTPEDHTSWVQAPSRTLITGTPRLIQFQFSSPLPAGRVYISTHVMGGVSQMAALVQSLLTNYPTIASIPASANASAIYNTSPAETDGTGRAVGGKPQYAVKLQFGGTTTDGNPKRKLVMGTHIHGAGEAASWGAFRYMLDYIMSSTDSQAVALRANWDVYIYGPIMPNSLYGGAARFTWRDSLDPNRAWVLSGDSVFQENTATRAAIELDTGGAADAFLVWHTWGGATSLFNYGACVDDQSPATRHPAAQAFFDIGTTIFGQSPQSISAAVNTTGSWWGRAKLGAPISFEAEVGQDAVTAPATQQFIGESWAKTLQAVDAAGLFHPISAELAGAAVSISSATGSLSTSIRMAGASGSLSLADGDLSSGIRLRGQGLSASSGRAVLSAASAGLVGVGVTGSLAVGYLDTEIRLSGVGASRSEVWADLKSASVGLLGAAQSISVGLGELRTGIRLAVTARSQSAARATLVGGEPELPPPWRVLRLRYPSRILRLRP